METAVSGHEPEFTAGGKSVQMDRAIFNLNASVEATSLYILLCAVEDQGAPLTLKEARTKWNGTAESLMAAAEELIRRGVMEAAAHLTDEAPLLINSKEKWC